MKQPVFTGSGVAIITPFTNDSVDYAALAALVEFQLSGGTDAIIVCGTTGEAATMSALERSRTIEAVVRQVDGRVPVIAGTGCNCTAAAIEQSKAAEAAGIDCQSVVLSPSSHAGYYPGARNMTMKVVFENGTARLLGAQIVGYEGVDKRIDVLATAIRAGLKATELTELDLAYAPPYSSAKDPVNMAGYIIENIMGGRVKQFTWRDIAALRADGGAYLLDARTPQEYAAGHAEGFVNIPLDDLRSRMGEVPKDKRIYVMCHSGLRSYLACRILAQNGFNCYNFSGGYAFLRAVALGGGMPEVTFSCGAEK